MIQPNRPAFATGEFARLPANPCRGASGGSPIGDRPVAWRCGGHPLWAAREVQVMTGVEVIVAALAAGAGVGAKDAAKTAVVDVYTGLRDALRKRLAGRDNAQKVLNAVR